jgi:hypothetical protein
MISYEKLNPFHFILVFMVYHSLKREMNDFDWSKIKHQMYNSNSYKYT